MTHKFVGNIGDVISRGNSKIKPLRPNASTNVGNVGRHHNIINNNYHGNFGKIDVDRIKFNKFTPDNTKTWKLYDEVWKKRRGDLPSQGELNSYARNTRPYHRYSKLIEESDALARTYGFKNERQLAIYIENAARLSKKAGGNKIINEDPRLLNLYHSLRTAKNKSGILKTALATGTVAGFVVYLANEQAKNSGCFRYTKIKDKNELIKHKVIGGNFCIGDKLITDEDSNIRKIPEESHPLFNHDKWDCDFSEFYGNNINETDRDKIDEIRQLGCNGLCDSLNFNFLATFTNGKYEPIKEKGEEGGRGGEEEEEEEEEKQYMYVCEKATFLRTAVDKTLDVIEDIAGVVMESSVIAKLYDRIYSICIFFLLLFTLYISLCWFKKWNTFPRHQGGIEKN